MRRAVLGTVAILMASGAMMGFAASYLVTPRYVAWATLSVTRNRAAASPRQLFRDAWNQTLSQESLVPMIFESSSWKEKLDLIPMEDLLRQIRDGSVMTSADLPGGVTRFTIEFGDGDRDVALDTTRGLLLRMSDNAGKVKPAGAGNVESATVEAARIVDPPHVREASPNRGLFAGAGLAVGLLAGALVGWAAARSGESMPPRSEHAASPPE
jgi:hypothetical protein